MLSVFPLNLAPKRIAGGLDEICDEKSGDVCVGVWTESVLLAQGPQAQAWIAEALFVLPRRSFFEIKVLAR